MENFAMSNRHVEFCFQDNYFLSYIYFSPGILKFLKKLKISLSRADGKLKNNLVIKELNKKYKVITATFCMDYMLQQFSMLSHMIQVLLAFFCHKGPLSLDRQLLLCSLHQETARCRLLEPKQVTSKPIIIKHFSADQQAQIYFCS